MHSTLKDSFSSRHCFSCLATIFSNSSAFICVFLHDNPHPPLPLANATTVFRYLILSLFGTRLNSSEYDSPASISSFRFIAFTPFSSSEFNALHKFLYCHPFSQTRLYQTVSVIASNGDSTLVTPPKAILPETPSPLPECLKPSTRADQHLRRWLILQHHPLVRRVTFRYAMSSFPATSSPRRRPTRSSLRSQAASIRFSISCSIRAILSVLS